MGRQRIQSAEGRVSRQFLNSSGAAGFLRFMGVCGSATESFLYPGYGGAPSSSAPRRSRRQTSPSDHRQWRYKSGSNTG